MNVEKIPRKNCLEIIMFLLMMSLAKKRETGVKSVM